MLTKSRIMMLFVLCLSLLLPENSRQSALAQTEDDPQAPTQKIFLPIIQGGNDEAEEVTAAASWGGPTCTNVAVGERALWFDSPGVGTVGAI